MAGYDGSNQSPGSGIGGRLLMAAIIALVGWFMYMNQSEENPVTKEMQHVSITPSEEIKLGIQSAPQMAYEMGGEVRSTDPRTIEVKKIGAFLVEHTVAKESPWQFEFHLLADPETINAFALPGGQIFITMGLLNQLDTEAELAGVLAHEMGHVIERHSAQQMATSQLGQILVVAAGSAVSDQAKNSVYQAAAVVNQAMQMSYSRGDESQADTWGLKLMEASGFNPEAMIQVMTILKAASGGSGRGIDFFQSHPNPDLRIKQIQEYLAKNPPPPGLTEGRNLKEVFRKG
jgi:predicted Zn-dependent protease